MIDNDKCQAISLFTSNKTINYWINGTINVPNSHSVFGSIYVATIIIVRKSSAYIHVQFFLPSQTNSGVQLTSLHVFV